MHHQEQALGKEPLYREITATCRDCRLSGLAGHICTLSCSLIFVAVSGYATYVDAKILAVRYLRRDGYVDKLVCLFVYAGLDDGNFW